MPQSSISPAKYTYTGVQSRQTAPPGQKPIPKPPASPARKSASRTAKGLARGAGSLTAEDWGITFAGTIGAILFIILVYNILKHWQGTVAIENSTAGGSVQVIHELEDVQTQPASTGQPTSQGKVMNQRSNQSKNVK